MKLFNKKSADSAVSPKKKVKNKFLLKYGSFSLGMAAIVLAAVIILNVLMGVLTDKGLLKLDLTTSGDYTISKENEEFLKKIDKKVDITVLSLQDSYVSNMNSYASNYYYVEDDSNYYEQTVNLLNRYPEINRNISVKYIDYFGSQTKVIAEEHPNIFYGDILVQYTDDSGNTKDRLVTFDDIYTYSDSTGMAANGYGSYYIDSNNVETAVTSAINILLYGEIKQLAVLSSHSTQSIFDQFYSNVLNLNGFEISNIDSAVVSEISSDIDTLVLAAPTKDLLPEEVTAISKWLDNGGKKGKSFIFIPSASVASFTNLNEFLQEWGIKYSSGQVYQTNSKYYYGTPTTTYGFASSSDITEKIVSNTESFCVLGQNVPMEKAFDSYKSKTPNIIISTNDTATVMPEGAGDNWSPDDDAELKSFANLIVTSDTEIIDEQPQVSYVAAFSSYEFIYSTWAQYKQIMNLDVALSTALYISGADSDSSITFVPKTISEESFADSVTAAKSNAISIIFIAVIPIAIVALGITVFVRRKKRCA